MDVQKDWRGARELMSAADHVVGWEYDQQVEEAIEILKNKKKGKQ